MITPKKSGCFFSNHKLLISVITITNKGLLMPEIECELGREPLGNFSRASPGARSGSTTAKAGPTPLAQDSLRVAQGGLSHDQAWLRTARRREGGIAR